MNDFEAYVTCPYNKSHRILKSRFQIHLTKCSKQYEKCTKDTKINCEFNSSHLLEPEEYEHHLSMCPSRANVICEQYVLGQDEQDIGIISLEDACNVQPNISNEDWSGNNPTYNPVKQTEDKNIIRLPIAMSKSEKKEFRQLERDRILFLENNSNISNNDSKISIIKQKTDFDEPLKAPKQLSKAILCNQDLTNYLISKLSSKLNKVSVDIDNNYSSSRKENLISKNISDEEEKENISKEENNVAASFQTSFQNISKINKISVEINNNSSKKENLILKSIFDEEKKNVFEEKNNVVTLSQNISKLNRISMNIDSSLSKKENLILKNISDEEEKENVSEEESNIAVSSQNISKIKKNILEVKTDFKTKARRYDTRTTIFSPEGRLYQVEYAMEAISHAGTCLGILATNGILLVAERRNINKLLDEVYYSEKIYKLNDDIVCSVAGITSDANVLTNELRLIAQRYLLQYGEPIPCEQLVSWLCDVKQAYTQYGGKRPFGVSILYMGWDKHYGYQLYQSDPSGNYGGWKATCIGHNSAAAVSSLKQEYDNNNITLEEAKALAIKVLSKTLDLNKLSGDKVEMVTLTRENGKTITRILPMSEVDALIAEHDRLEALAEQAKKEKQKL